MSGGVEVRACTAQEDKKMAVDRFMRYAGLLWLASLPGIWGDGGVKTLEEESLDREIRAAYMAWFFKRCCAWGTWVLFGGMLYSNCRTARPLPTELRRQSRSTFAFGLCECCHHCETSCWAFWFPLTVWSATASSPKSNFWEWTFWQLLASPVVPFSVSFLFLASLIK